MMPTHIITGREHQTAAVKPVGEMIGTIIQVNEMIINGKLVPSVICRKFERRLEFLQLWINPGLFDIGNITDEAHPRLRLFIAVPGIGGRGKAFRLHITAVQIEIVAFTKFFAVAYLRFSHIIRHAAFYPYIKTLIVRAILRNYVHETIDSSAAVHGRTGPLHKLDAVDISEEWGIEFCAIAIRPSLVEVSAVEHDQRMHVRVDRQPSRADDRPGPAVPAHGYARQI